MIYTWCIRVINAKLFRKRSSRRSRLNVLLLISQTNSVFLVKVMFMKTYGLWGDILNSSWTSKFRGKQILSYQGVGEAKTQQNQDKQSHRIGAIRHYNHQNLPFTWKRRLSCAAATQNPCVQRGLSSNGRLEITNRNQFLHTVLYRKQNVLMWKQGE